MPPKVKISKEIIVEKAFELTRKYGYDHVTARLLARELNCSTQPVFHVFRSMEELKHEVYLRTQRFFEEEMLKPPSGDTPYFLSMGLKYIELAGKEKHLFQLLCLSDSSGRYDSLSELAENMPVEMNKDIFVKVWIFAHGIATIVSTNTTGISQEEIRKMLTEAGESFRLYYEKRG